MPEVKKLAKALLFNSSGELLMLRRSATAPNRPLLIDLPGGKVDFGEQFDEAVIREIKEEIGLDFTSAELELLHISTNFYDNSSFLRALYVGRIIDDKPIVLSPEHDEFYWMSLEEVVEKYDHPVWNEAIRYLIENKFVG